MVTTIDWDAARTAEVLRYPTDDDDKYSRGVVGMVTGSEEYPGAAVLGVEAAWRAGTGMVRYLGDPRPAGLVLARRPETVTAPGRVQAWVVGSGTDAASRSPVETERLRRILFGDVPVVVDAGALDLVIGATAPLVLTPHARELDRVRDLLGLARAGAHAAEDERVVAVRETAARLGAVVLLKGAATLVADPEGTVRRVHAGTPWLATAGTGDVLAGAIGAVVAGAAAGRADGTGAAGGFADRTGAAAGHADGTGAAGGLADGTDAAGWLADAAAAGAWLHGRAAVHAALRFGAAGGPITALDVAEALPFAFALAGGRAGYVSASAWADPQGDEAAPL